MKKTYKYSFLALTMVVMAGCAKFFDVNQDINNPTSVKPSQLLLAPEVTVFDVFGDGASGLGDLTGQWVHHTVQRGANNFYFMDGNEFAIQDSWGNEYNGALEDLNLLIEQGQAKGNWHHAGIAQILKAYTLATTVDVYGIAVDTEFGVIGNNAPHFDTGEEIYAHALTLIDDGIKNLYHKVLNTQRVDTEDQVFGGEVANSKCIERWIRFGYSLKLKLYNQVRLTSMYDAAAVAALITKDSFMTSTAGGFRLKYTSSTTPENRHPLFSQDYTGGVSNYIDPFCFYFMNGANSATVPSGYFQPLNQRFPFAGVADPRIPYYFYNQLKTGEAPQNPFTLREGNFLGIWFASFNIDPKEGFDQSSSSTLVGLYPCGGPYDNASGANHTSTSGLAGAGYQRLYPFHSHLFTKAELALTEATGEDPRALLSSGIDAAFQEVTDAIGTSGAPSITAAGVTYRNSILALYDAAATTIDKLEIIMASKWVANFKSGPDAYTDYRRTGFPVMFDPATDNNPLTVLNRNYPLTFPLNSIEIKTNPNAPTDRLPGVTTVFWDIN